MTYKAKIILATVLLAVIVMSDGAQAAVYPLPPPGEDLVGPENRQILPQARDNLAAMALRHQIGFRALIRANPRLDPWRLNPQQPITLPTSQLLPQTVREGIVINVPEMRLYYYPKGESVVHVYPIAVGRVDWPTPLGKTYVRAKVANPVWNPPETIRREHAALGDPLPVSVPAGPDNPLGKHALRLGWPQILIHGTNDALAGIGMPVTHGCVRLYPRDIETLYSIVPVGTPVTFIDEQYKLGRHRNRWLLEAHAPLAADPHASITAAQFKPAVIKLRHVTSSAQINGLDWRRMELVMQRHTGVPVTVSAVTPAPRAGLSLSAYLPVRDTYASAPKDSDIAGEAPLEPAKLPPGTVVAKSDTAAAEKAVRADVAALESTAAVADAAALPVESGAKTVAAAAPAPAQPTYKYSLPPVRTQVLMPPKKAAVLASP